MPTWNGRKMWGLFHRHTRFHVVSLPSGVKVKRSQWSGPWPVSVRITRPSGKEW